MSTTKNIKWGILGLGKIAHKFASDLRTVSGCELYAVASRNQEKADEFAQIHQAKIGYDSYEKLAKDPEIDAIYIATPHSFHKEFSILCLQHKKAVLCEKAFAMNLEEVSEMIQTAKENDTLLMEALWTRFLPHYQYVLDVVKNEKYGKIQKLEADFGFYAPYDLQNRLFRKEVGGGSLLDIGIYPIFAALSTLGIPEKIDAKATFFENGADSSCDMVFHYKDAKAYLKSTLLENTPITAIFHFEKATLTINRPFHGPSNVTILQNNVEETINFDNNTHGYNFEIAHFNQLLNSNKKESDLMTFEFSKNLMQTLDAVRNIIGLDY
ncbi:MAG: Gfo/Idh/MocA family oxidoreductase [Polaribacter sp.]|nr:Gfo/Idh/MocA family oxidoreductase [Polaribacter sp.]